jgi:large subunit ribosomal protein L44
MTFYNKYIKPGMKGYTLRGGPFAKWRFPLNKVLYRKRLAAGPEPERPRAVWSNWNYDSEIFAFGKRLNEEFNESLLKQAFIDPTYAISQKNQLKELGVFIISCFNFLKNSTNSY